MSRSLSIEERRLLTTIVINCGAFEATKALSEQVEEICKREPNPIVLARDSAALKNVAEEMRLHSPTRL
jgi:hypothetical protein